MCHQRSSWCLSFVHRQSQLASQGPVALAEKLTQSLRNTGDLDFVDIDLQSYVVTSRHVVCASQSECHRESLIPRDDDEIMLSATRGSQFTQSLMLFVRPSYTLRNRPQLFPSHNAVVADSGRHALHTTPDALLGVHSAARTIDRHRKCSRSAKCPRRASSKWAIWRTALPYRRVGPPSCALQRLGGRRTGISERGAFLRLCDAT